MSPKTALCDKTSASSVPSAVNPLALATPFATKRTFPRKRKGTNSSTCPPCASCPPSFQPHTSRHLSAQRRIVSGQMSLEFCHIHTTMHPEISRLRRSPRRTELPTFVRSNVFFIRDRTRTRSSNESNELIKVSNLSKLENRIASLRDSDLDSGTKRSIAA
jgi:hypothetical protein